MTETGWRQRAGTTFECEKTPVIAQGGMVVTNHPLASAAAVEMLAAGGNAIDAAIAALFTLTVVEPMMVGIYGGGTALIRLAEGRELTIDGLATAPAEARPDSFVPVSETWPDYMETEGRRNRVGGGAVPVPGNLKAWCETLERFGTLSLEQVMEPAIRHAERGFRVTPYLSSCIEETAEDLALDPVISSLFLPGGKPLEDGALLVQSDYGRTLRAISKHGPDHFYSGPLGEDVVRKLRAAGSFVSLDDLKAYRTVEREPIRVRYRGVDIVGVAPPCTGGVHIAQMLNLLEPFDIGSLGYGTPESLHLMLEVLKIAAADRRAATADPAFVNVPVERLISKSYADLRRAEIQSGRAGKFGARVLEVESANTTHLTIADRHGNVISSTQTINSLFGARIMVPGTGIIPTNYMYLFDPHPGRALSLQPGKRITSGISATIATKNGKPLFAVGLPGAHRIPSAVFQMILNVIDHGMTLQEAVEAPRLFTWGEEAELERGFSESVQGTLQSMGHDVLPVDHVAGGMGAIFFNNDGSMTGASCWRADGTPMGIGGGLARRKTAFWPDPTRNRKQKS